MGAEERFEVRFSPVRLLIGLAFTVIPISIAGLYSTFQSHNSLRQAVGNHFKTMAESTAAATAQFIHDRVTDVRRIATDSIIVDAAAAAERSYTGLSEEAVAARIEKIDKAWNTPASESAVKQMLGSPASHRVWRHRELDPRILRITVTDVRGVTVAASHKTLDYYQADEEYWQNIYAQGRGAVSITDVLYDEAARTTYIGIGVPILEEGTGRFLGTVDALLDVASLRPIVNRIQIGETGRTLLVKDDGTVISGPGADLAMNVKSREFAVLREVLQGSPGLEAGYLIAQVSGSGENMIGFASTKLRSAWPKLGWLILLCQDTKQAFAPVRLAERMVALMSLLGLVMVTMAGAWYALHRRQPLTGIGQVQPDAAAGPSGGEQPRTRSATGG